MKEIELALNGKTGNYLLEMNDISAYNTNEDLFVEVNNDTHILVSS